MDNTTQESLADMQANIERLIERDGVEATIERLVSLLENDGWTRQADDDGRFVFTKGDSRFSFGVD